MTQPVAPPVPVAAPYPGASDLAIEAWWQGRALKRPSWGFPDYLIAVALWLVFSIGSGVFLVLAADGTAAYAWVLVLTVTIPWIGLGGWPWLVSRLRGNGARLDFGLRVSFGDIGWGLVYGGIALVLAAAIAAATAAIFGEFDSSAGQVAESLGDFPLQRFLFAVAVGIGAPIVEELCYRGLLLTSLLKRDMSRVWAVVISAALFAAMHMEPVRFALLFAIGLVLGVARVHRNNTTTPIVAHMTNNMVGAIGVLFMLD